MAKKIFCKLPTTNKLTKYDYKLSFCSHEKSYNGGYHVLPLDPSYISDKKCIYMFRKPIVTIVP